MKQQIINGDCLEIMRTFADKSFDLVLTDPPYDFTEEQKLQFHKEFMRIGKSVIVFAPPENQWIKPDQYGFWVKQLTPRNISKKYSRFVEMIFFYGDLKWNRGLGRNWVQYTNVFTEFTEDERKHPFQKPETLFRRLIRNHSDIGDTILDPFMGSGTTLLTAKQLNRNAVGIEISPEYCEIARQRI